MAEQTISCPSCGKKIIITRALRSEIEASVRVEFERELRDEVEQARKDAAKSADKRTARRRGFGFEARPTWDVGLEGRGRRVNR